MFATVVSLAIAASLPASSPIAAREGQWVQRQVLGDGTRQPTAVFLSWDYSTVIFTVTCDRPRKEVVLRHYLDAGVEPPSVPQIIFRSGRRTVAFKTTREGNVVIARALMTAPLHALLTGRGELEIDAPNEMNEPYYVGFGRPLRNVALACR